MDAMFEDPSVFDIFARGKSFDYSEALKMNVEVLDWTKDNNVPRVQSVTAPELANTPEPNLRIVLMPLDCAGDMTTHGLLWAFKHYSIPSAFVEERIRAVTHSFGTQNDSNGNNCLWFHHLSKRILVKEDVPGGESRIYSVTKTEKGHELEFRQQANWSWTKSGYFLKWNIIDSGDPRVTLLCFGAPKLLEEQLRSLQTVGTALRDPLALLVIILSVISCNLDSTIWSLSDVFGKMEMKALTLSQERESFTGLHNVAKHIIYLQESCDATALIVQKVLAHSKLLHGKASDESKLAMENTFGMLTQVETGFETLNLRLRSLDRRMQGVIALSFHLVAAEGTEIMQSDSNTMTTIGLVTLIFLPLSTVSTIFGGQFLGLSGDNTLQVSKDFWIFWAISVPVTAIVLGAWYAMRKKRNGLLRQNKQIVAQRELYAKNLGV